MAYEWINEKTGEPLNKTKMVDGEIVDLTSEEISKIETERETAIEQQAIDKDNEKTNRYFYFYVCYYFSNNIFFRNNF